MHHAPRTMRYVPCTMHLTCTMHHTPPITHLVSWPHLSARGTCITLPHPFTLLWLAGLQLRVAHPGLGSQDNQQDPFRTPRRQGRRTNASGIRRFPGNSRSRSPTRRAQSSSTHPRPSPPPYSRQSSQYSPSKHQAFQASTGSQGHPVCALCLATDSHDTRRCRSESLWDGSKVRCKKSEEGRLITPSGTTLCSDWNSRRGCSSNAHETRHECSGCGSKDHGAQKCPRAQKKQSPLSL